MASFRSALCLVLASALPGALGAKQWCVRGDACWPTADDVAAAYRTVRREIECYGAGLGAKTEIVCLNKCDALTPEDAEDRQRALADACGQEVNQLSGVAGTGVDKVLRRLLSAIKAGREAGQSAEAPFEPAR